MSQKPGADILVDLILEHVPANALVLDLGGAPVPSPKLASRRIIPVREDEALTVVEAQAHGPVDAIVSAWPARFVPLIPLLQAAHDALRADGRLLLVDLVWQTAPSPELMRAFAAAPGREKVRPIEGYEMQIDHCGFDIVQKTEVPRERWTRSLTPDQRGIVSADMRGAARCMSWVLRPRTEE